MNISTAVPPLVSQVNSPRALKQQVIRVVLAIALFVIVYAILMLAVFAVSLGLGALGIWILFAKVSWITVLLASGFIATAASLSFFIIKFIFTRSQKNNNLRVQIFESEHPQLFGFLRDLARQTGTPFPKKVFITPEVSACVYYNSSILSMFLPVKKNLELGLGLVNVLNVSEFKAVVAHEFGHFSQRSMKMGSYTYSINLVLYNILYQNDSYEKFLNAWGSAHGLLSLFMRLTVWILQFIQWVLRGVYKIVNKEYLALSRQMEYDADTIAAQVAGGNNLLSALAKFSLASACYDRAVDHANEYVEDKKRLKNIYTAQSLLMRLAAEENGISYQDDLPVIPISNDVGESSRIGFKSVWASHPTLSERKNNLDIANVHVKPDSALAWSLFSEHIMLQEGATDSLYKTIEFEQTPAVLTEEEYEASVNDRLESNRLPAAYNGFYNNRYPEIDIDVVHNPKEMPAGLSFEDLFSITNGKIYSNICSLKEEIQTLESIKAGHAGVRHFHFDGIKYKARESEAVIAQLRSEIITEEQRLKELDALSYIYFYNRVVDPAVLKEHYLQFIELRTSMKDIGDILGQVNEVFHLISGTITIEEAQQQAGKLKELDEFKLKPQIRGMIKNQEKGGLPEDLYANINNFLSKEYVYFHDTSFLENELIELYKILNGVYGHLVSGSAKAYKNLLQYQLDSLMQPYVERKEINEERVKGLSNLITEE